MSTAPRAARGGKKVLSTPSPQLTSTPPILTEGPVDLSSFLSQVPAPAPTTTSSNASNGNNNTNNSDPLSGGVVRGRARDHQTSVKERDPGAKQSEVESKLRDAFATLVNKSGATKSDNNQDDESKITAEKVNANAVTLIAESHAFSTASKILKDSNDNRVLIVSSLEDVIASSNIKIEGDNNNNSIKVASFYGTEKNLPTTAAALSDSRLWFTTFRSMISFLNVFFRDISLACPFTHIILVAKDGKCSPLFDSALSVTCNLIFSASVGLTAEEAEKQQKKNNNNNNKGAAGASSVPKPRSGKQNANSTNVPAPLLKKAFGENVKIVLAGVSSIEDIKNAISAPDKSFTLAAESLVQTELKHAPVMFSSFEAAALASTMVKEYAPSSVSLRRLPGAVSSLPQSLIEHGVSVATSTLVKAVQAASSEKLTSFRCAVIGAELNELQSAITAALPADSFTIYTEVKDFMTNNNNNNSSQQKKVSILLLSRALNASASAQLRLHLVVDSGTERRAQIPPQSEMQFPIKVVLAPTKREAQARKSMAGWCDEGPGLFIAAADFTGGKKNNNSGSPTTTDQDSSAEIAAKSNNDDDEQSSPARGVDNSAINNNNNNGASSASENEIDGDEDLLEPVCDAVLTLAQNGLDLTHLVRDPRRGREAQLGLALPFLTDLGFITQTKQYQNHYAVITTFLGEICARSGLPPDFACIVINGLACGMTDAAVFVATAAARPFRAASSASTSSSPASTTTSENEFGDSIEDAITLSEGVAAFDADASTESIKKYLASRNKSAYPIHLESFEASIRVAKIVQRGIEDFVIPSSSSSSSSTSPAAIRKQITDNVNLLVAFVAAALARRAVVIRHEGDERINTISRGNLLFTHTAKEVVPNRFMHSGAAWKKDMVVICSSIQNTPTRLLGSGCTSVSNDYFMGCLFALSPVVAYEQISIRNNNTVNHHHHHGTSASFNNNNNAGDSHNNNKEDNSDNILLSVALNKLEKTSLISQHLADQLLKLRDQWKTLMAHVQLRRATAAKSASQFKELAAKHLDKRFNLENAQSEYIAELCELISDFHVNVPLGSSNIGRDLSRVRSHVLCAPVPPSSLTSIAVPSDFAVAKEIATMVAPAVTADDADDNNNKMSAAASNNVVQDDDAQQDGSDVDAEETDVIIDDD